VSGLFEEVLLCPACRGGRPERGEEAYACPACGRSYPVLEGVPRLLEDVPEGSRQVQRVFDFEHRRYGDSWYTRFEPRLVDQFLEECELPAEFFRGKRVLDAGCGSGRWSYALAELGADVVAFDLTSGGIEMAHEQLGDRDNVSICQADLFEPPFAPESFDFVMSWGVLHHTPDTRRAFRSIAPLVKAGGTLFVMVYERIYPVRLFGTNLLRAVLRRVSDEQRYRFCSHLVIRNPWLARLLNPFLMIAHYDPNTATVDPQTLQFGLFDAYSPRYNHVHTHAEVRTWFEEAGFGDVTSFGTRGSVRARGTREVVPDRPQALEAHG
jgi:2-polyprenyl-3-methyl-5-hydroxy-6-metoxy-1,4-benzoquinol methylase